MLFFLLEKCSHDISVGVVWYFLKLSGLYPLIESLAVVRNDCRKCFVYSCKDVSVTLSVSFLFEK